jgi:hypothetical protein
MPTRKIIFLEIDIKPINVKTNLGELQVFTG